MANIDLVAFFMLWSSASRPVSTDTRATSSDMFARLGEILAPAQLFQTLFPYQVLNLRHNRQQYADRKRPITNGDISDQGVLSLQNSTRMPRGYRHAC